MLILVSTKTLFTVTWLCSSPASDRAYLPTLICLFTSAWFDLIYSGIIYQWQTKLHLIWCCDRQNCLFHSICLVCFLLLGFIIHFLCHGSQKSPWVFCWRLKVKEVQNIQLQLREISAWKPARWPNHSAVPESSLCTSDITFPAWFLSQIRPCLVLKIFPTVPVTLNLRTHV